MRWPAAFAVLVTLFSLTLAQDPPRPLPPSVTGGAVPSPGPLSPTSGIATATTAPIGRFQNLQAYPAETIAALYSARAGADWLWRMNQSSGRFFPGINPAVRLPLETDTEFRQALAALALVEAARFTGDERFAARGVQSVLSLLTATKADQADPSCRVPVAPSERCNRVGFASVLALAIFSLPNPDPTLLAQAAGLCRFLQKQCRSDGAFLYTDGPTDDPMKVDPAGLSLYPGFAIQALVASCRAKSDPATTTSLAKSIAYYREAFKSRPSPMMAATLLPGIVEFALANGKEANATTAAFELADWLCEHQYSRIAPRNPMWFGGFGTGGEPGYESSGCIAGLAAAAKLTRQVPDLTRFRKYRTAAVEGLLFARGLQFSDETAAHFDKSFRAQFLNGGVHLSPSDGVVRLDATACLVLAEFTFLQSGAEGHD